jgi:hypothetical protein
MPDWVLTVDSQQENSSVCKPTIICLRKAMQLQTIKAGSLPEEFLILLHQFQSTNYESFYVFTFPPRIYPAS